ncbi:hypothetical protein [Tahibacter aquaticus]|nr:hypothetical protein [Tahibacter aquaticus]
MVLAANVVATAVVVFAFVTPSAFNPPSVGALYGYAYIGSLVLSVGGGLALMIRQNNPWWLLTLPWAVVLVAVLLAIARAMGVASMH